MVALPTPARVATCSRRSPENPSSTSSAWAASTIARCARSLRGRPRRGAPASDVADAGSIDGHPDRLRNGAYQCTLDVPERILLPGPPPTGAASAQAAMATSWASSWRWCSTRRHAAAQPGEASGGRFLERGALEVEAVALGIDGHELTARAEGGLAQGVVDELQHLQSVVDLGCAGVRRCRALVWSS